MSCEHYGKKKSSLKMKNVFEEPMARGEVRRPQIWEVDEKTDYDKPTYRKKASTSMNREECVKKSHPQMKPFYFTTDFGQPMPRGEMRRPQIWEVDDKTHLDKPTLKKVYMKSEDFGKKSTPQMKPIYVTTDFAQPMSRGSVRRPQIWELDDETDCDKPTPQETNRMDQSETNNFMQSFTNSIARNGVTSRFYPDKGDGVQKYQKIFMKNNQVVGGEEYTIYSYD